MFTAAALKSEQSKQISPSTLKTKQATLNLPCADENSQPLLSVYLACLWNGPWPVISSPSRCACVGRGTTLLSLRGGRQPGCLKRQCWMQGWDYCSGELLLPMAKEPRLPSHSAEWDVVFCSNPSPGQVTRRRWNMQCNPASGCWKLWRNCSGDHWHAGWHTAPLFLKCEATTLVTMDVRSTWLQEKRIRAHLDRSTNEIKHFKT